MTEFTPSKADVEQACEQIADCEYLVTQAHQTQPHTIGQEQPPGYVADDAVEIDILAKAGHNETTERFVENPFLRNGTLRVVLMYGDWDAANKVEEQIAGPQSLLRDEPYNAQRFTAEDPRAERTIAVNWNIVSMFGLTAVARHRRLLTTEVIEEELEFPNRHRYATRSQIEVDKHSTFVLDISELDKMDRDAVREVRLIILCGMLASCNLDRMNRAMQEYKQLDAKTDQDLLRDKLMLLRVREKMKEYGYTYDEVAARAFPNKNDGHPPTNRLRDPASITTVEQAIHARHNLLTPATTTYYAERKLLETHRI